MICLTFFIFSLAHRVLCRLYSITTSLIVCLQPPAILRNSSPSPSFFSTCAQLSFLRPTICAPPPQSLPTPYHLLIPLIVPPTILEVPCSPPQQLFVCLSQNIKYPACRARQSLKKFALHRTATSGPGPFHPVYSSWNYPLGRCEAPGLFRALSSLSEEQGGSIYTCSSRLVSVKQFPIAKLSSGYGFLLLLLGHSFHP